MIVKRDFAATLACAQPPAPMLRLAAAHADCALLSFYSAAKGDMAFGH
jgi:hypothetical protein